MQLQVGIECGFVEEYYSSSKIYPSYSNTSSIVTPKTFAI